MSDPSNPAPLGKAIADIPLWMAILLALASGLSGEMLRASTLINLTWKQLAARIGMRFGAAGFAGIAVFMLAFAYEAHPYVAAALCIFSAMVGGDVASSLFERWASKRIGVCDVPSSSGNSDQQPPK
tara:strand:- start:22805 stop:23185 length:381 start_codon:yes stop_codon:yes gene_type:complete